MIGTPTPITQPQLANKFQQLNDHRDKRIPYRATILSSVQMEVRGYLVTFTLTNDKGYFWKEEYWLVNG